jgi:hypothetical protein
MNDCNQANLLILNTTCKPGEPGGERAFPVKVIVIIDEK